MFRRHIELRRHEFKLPLGFERQPSRQHFVEHHAPRINVASCIKRNTPPRFRRYEVKRSRRVPAACGSPVDFARSKPFDRMIRSLVITRLAAVKPP